MFSKWKSRLNATRFEFSVHVHTLQPWPAGSKAVAIGWQRGKRRRGATNSVLPLPNKDGLGTVVRFNEKFSLTSTLYKAPGAESRSSQVGPFKKKCLILAVLETDGRTHATAALGRIVIDLSEFASIDGQELRTFSVACNKSIHAAVGEPQLTVTIKCRWKKAGADMTEDEVASMSTDTTGSNLTTNLRDFFSRGKLGGSGGLMGSSKASKRDEQDLKGFGGPDGMATIGEELSDEEGGGGAGIGSGLRAGGGGAAGVGGGGGRDEDDYQDYDSTRGSIDGEGSQWGAQDLEYDAVGALNLHDDDDGYMDNNNSSSRAAAPGGSYSGGNNRGGAGSSSSRGPSAGAVGVGAVGMGAAAAAGVAAGMRGGGGGERGLLGRGGGSGGWGDAAAAGGERGGMYGDRGVYNTTTTNNTNNLMTSSRGSNSSGVLSPSGPYEPSPLMGGGAGGGMQQQQPYQQQHQYQQQQQQHDHYQQPHYSQPSSSYQQQQQQQPGSAKSSSSSRPGRSWRMEGVDSGSGVHGSGVLGSRQGAPSPTLLSAAVLDRQQSGGIMSMQSTRRPLKSTSTQTELADLSPAEPQLDDVSSLQDELLLAAATEFAIYNAQRHLLPSRSPIRAVHSPARRIARTLVCLGRQDGLPFGHLALRQVGASVVANRSDIKLLAFWWTNSVHLRGFLQSLNLALEDGSGPTSLHWASEAFVPRLLQQEKFIFDELVSYVWTHTFVPAVAASRARPANAALAAGVVKRSGQEAALRKWLGALEAVATQLQVLGRDGHVSTLKHQVLLEVMKRMDVLIFHFLINPPSDGFSEGGSSSTTTATATHNNQHHSHSHSHQQQPDSPGGSSSMTHGDSHSNNNQQQQQSQHQVLRDTINPNMPMLDDSMLFFTRGVLTFGTGMNLKMACTRFQQWAFGDGGMREIWSNLPAQGQCLFPLLRSTSDLLMMPKDLLLEEGIRADMCSSLPLDTLVFMLNRFTADDFSKEGIPAEVLVSLRSESVSAGLGDGSSPPELEVEGECTYYSPTDDMAMEKVEAGEEPGLEYDGESEEELDAVGALCTDPTAGLQPPLRFKLLHNLWSTGVPRATTMTIARQDSAADSQVMEAAPRASRVMMR